MGKAAFLARSKQKIRAERPGQLAYSLWIYCGSVPFAENFWNVFDQLVAPTAFYHRREEVVDWFNTASLKDVEITRRNNNSWRGTGLVPTIKRETRAAAE